MNTGETGRERLMELKQFEKQINRLKDVYGEKNYSPERIKLFFKAFRDADIWDFALALDLLIMNKRTAPMQEDVAEKLAKVVHDRKRGEETQMPVDLTLRGVPSGKADPAFVALCRKTLNDFQTGKISKSEFKKKCDGLDNLAKQISRSKRQDKGVKTGGMRIGTWLNCDSCGERFYWQGESAYLLDSRNYRLCPNCKGIDFALNLPSK